MATEKKVSYRHVDLSNAKWVVQLNEYGGQGFEFVAATTAVSPTGKPINVLLLQRVE